MPKRTSRKFPDSLNTPIPELILYPFGDREDAAGYKEFRDQRLAEIRIKKLRELLEHYGISEHDHSFCQKLVTALVIDLFRGMQVVNNIPKRGRPKGKCKSAFLSQICVEFDTIKREKPRLSILRIAELLIKRNPETWGRYTAQSLKTRYWEAKKKFETEKLNGKTRFPQLAGDMGLLRIFLSKRD